MTQLTNENGKQFQLFEEENAKHLVLMQLMDRINSKIGDRKIKLATQGHKIGRNDPCPCGSGKKYKQCHGRLN